MAKLKVKGIDIRTSWGKSYYNKGNKLKGEEFQI